MIKLWDDRCVSVIPNTGEIIPLDSNERVKELEKEKSELLAKCEKYEYEIGLAKQQIAALESKSNMYIDLAVAMASTARKVDGLEKERNRLQEALQVIASGHFSGRVELVNTEEMKTVWKSNVGLPMRPFRKQEISRARR